MTINEGKSISEPTTKLVYLGFKIDTRQMTIQLTLTAHDWLTGLLRHTRNGSLKDRQRIARYAQWILFNLRQPHFLARGTLLGDPSWVFAAMRDLSVLQHMPLMDGPMAVNLFTDATPHSVAAILPSMGISMAQAFQHPEEINRAEALGWA